MVLEPSTEGMMQLMTYMEETEKVEIALVMAHTVLALQRANTAELLKMRIFTASGYLTVVVMEATKDPLKDYMLSLESTEKTKKGIPNYGYQTRQHSNEEH